MCGDGGGCGGVGTSGSSGAGVGGGKLLMQGVVGAFLKGQEWSPHSRSGLLLTYLLAALTVA